MTMRILHIGMMGPELDRSARELGHEVVRINWRDYYNGKHNRFARYSALQDDIIKAFGEFGPDLVFIQQHECPAVGTEVIDFMRQEGGFVVNWTGDVRDPLPHIYVEYARHVDVTAFTNWDDVHDIRYRCGYRAEYLQIGYDETIYKPDGPVLHEADIVFMGNNYAGRFPLSQHRYDVVMALKEAFGDRFKVYGRNWGPGVRAVVGEEEAAIYRGARLAINLDHFDRPGFMSDRTIRANACGVAVADGTSVSAHDLIKAVASYNADELVKEGKWEAARALNEDTWHSRIRQMEEWVSDHNKSLNE